MTKYYIQVGCSTCTCRNLIESTYFSGLCQTPKLRTIGHSRYLRALTLDPLYPDSPELSDGLDPKQGTFVLEIIKIYPL